MKTVVEASKESRLETLKAMRHSLAEQIDAGGGTVAQCVAQMRNVLAEIEEIEGPPANAGGKVETKKTPLSEFEEKLANRRAATKAGGKERKSG